LALARLLPPPPSCVIDGSIEFGGTPVLSCAARQLRALRGGGIAYVFQEPSMALNPAWKIGFQVAESVRYHQPDVTDMKACVLQYFVDVGITNPERFYGSYPHELSGGMQQRAVIAMAIACRPKLLVADEPTTALDVSLQLQITNLLKTLQNKYGVALLLITHNFSLLPDLVQRVLVMFRGRIVEQGTPEEVLRAPRHPYTRALINCIPRLGARRTPLQTIDYQAL
jgi:peptide/nickel transport system ATP-binding protein/oligopeptide transport system ATP-binding protein